jgi:hypothetical protein
MSRIARTIVMALVLSAILGSSGCISVCTDTYAEYPPSNELERIPPQPPQGNPSDG